jgi:outer membrane lipopolysaccharide assembly protein LptE/RlpB
MKKLYLSVFSILAFLFLTACQFDAEDTDDVVDDSSSLSEPPEDPTSFTESYQSCLESHESESNSPYQKINVGLKDDVDLDDFVSDYNLEPDYILRLEIVGYTVERGTQAEWICLFLEDDRVTFAELEGRPATVA